MISFCMCMQKERQARKSRDILPYEVCMRHCCELVSWFAWQDDDIFTTPSVENICNATACHTSGTQVEHNDSGSQKQCASCPWQFNTIESRSPVQGPWTPPTQQPQQHSCVHLHRAHVVVVVAHPHKVQSERKPCSHRGKSTAPRVTNGPLVETVFPGLFDIVACVTQPALAVHCAVDPVGMAPFLPLHHRSVRRRTIHQAFSVRHRMQACACATRHNRRVVVPSRLRTSAGCATQS